MNLRNLLKALTFAAIILATPVCLTTSVAQAELSSGQRQIDKPASFEVRGTKIRMTGYIDSQTQTKLENVLKFNPQITTLEIFDCPGTTDTNAAFKLAYFVRNRGLNTHVPSFGMAAFGALDLFLAGKERTVEPRAYLGVRSWQDAQLGEGSDYLRTNPNSLVHQAFRNFYLSMGTKDGFYEFKVNAANSRSVHWLTEAELEEWKITTPKQAENPGQNPPGNLPGTLPGQNPPGNLPGQNPPGNLPGQLPGQNPPGNLPGQNPPGTIPGQNPPGNLPGQNPPGQLPGQNPPGNLPGQNPPGTLPGQNPPGQLPGQNPPGTLPGQNPPGNLPGQNPPGTLPGQNPPSTLPGQNPPGTLPGQNPPVDNCVVGTWMEKRANGKESLITIKANGEFVQQENGQTTLTGTLTCQDGCLQFRTPDGKLNTFEMTFHNDYAFFQTPSGQRVTSLYWQKLD